MTKSRTISVKITNPGKKGAAILYFSGRRLRLSVDEVRKLYYAVLGIEMVDKRSVEQIVDTSTYPVEVDVPEDILRVEKVINDVNLD